MSASSLFSRVKDMTSHVVDTFFPSDSYEDEEEVVQPAAKPIAQPRQAAYDMEQRQVVNGGTVSFSGASYGTSASTVRTPSTGDGGGTPLTVHTTKVAELKVRIHRPRRYDDVGAAVRQLKQGIAVTVNFDCLNEPERRRVCDFLNGACYVLHGTARMVSSTIILYAPKGVDVTESTAKPV